MVVVVAQSLFTHCLYFCLCQATELLEENDESYLNLPGYAWNSKVGNYHAMYKENSKIASNVVVLNTDMVNRLKFIEVPHVS